MATTKQQREDELARRAQTIQVSDDDLSVTYDADILNDSTITIRRTVVKKAYRRTDQTMYVHEEIATLNVGEAVSLVRDLVGCLAMVKA